MKDFFLMSNTDIFGLRDADILNQSEELKSSNMVRSYLDVMRGRINIFSILIRSSPGKEK